MRDICAVPWRATVTNPPWAPMRRQCSARLKGATGTLVSVMARVPPSDRGCSSDGWGRPGEFRSALCRLGGLAFLLPCGVSFGESGQEASAARVSDAGVVGVGAVHRLAAEQTIGGRWAGRPIPQRGDLGGRQ